MSRSLSAIDAHCEAHAKLGASLPEGASRGLSSEEAAQDRTLLDAAKAGVPSNGRTLKSACAVLPPLPASRKKPVRVLFLATFLEFMTKLSRQFMFTFEAAQRHPAVSRAVAWGPGWNGWVEGDDVASNVMRRFGGRDAFEFDLIYTL